MGTHDKPTELHKQEQDRSPAMGELHVRQVEDRALPARQVLLEQSQDRENDERGAIFVP